MALTAQQLQANADYQAGKIDANTYKNLYITKPQMGATSTATASGTKKDFVPQTPQANTQIAAPVMPEMPMAQEVPQMDYAAELAKQQQALVAAQKQSQLASLQKAYTSSQGALNQEGTVIPQTYKAARTQADTQFQQNNRRFSDYLAQRGLASSGSAAQGFINLTGSMQGAKSKANADQANALSDLQRRRTDLETGYQFDQQAVSAGSAADLAKYQMESLLTQQDRFYKQQDTADDRKYDETLYNRDKADLEAANAKNAQLDTLGRYSNDYTQGIIDIKGDGDASNDWLIPYLESARTQKVAGIESSKSEAAAAQYENAMDMWKLMGYVPQGYESVLGVPVGTPTSDYSYKQAQLELDRFKAQTGRISAVKVSGGGDDPDPKLTYNQFENMVLTKAENDPESALQSVVENMDMIKDAKDYDAYVKLKERIEELVAARKRSQNNSEMMGIMDIFGKLK